MKYSLYDYLDEKGTFLFQVVKIYPKQFLQRRWVENKWVWGLKGVRRVLYNLPEVVKSEYVIFVEGEKDVETLRKLGLVATTCPCGSGSWKSEYNELLRDKKVSIIPDNDNAGFNLAVDIACNVFDIARVVRIITLPYTEAKEDVTDLIEKGLTKEGLINIIKHTVPLTRKELEPYFPKPKKKKSKYVCNNQSGITPEMIEYARNYPIEDIISVNDSGKAYCIAHEENIPSMDTRKNYCYCYSCGWHGDTIKLYQLLHKVSFIQAIKELNAI